MENKSYPILVFELDAETRSKWVRLLLAAGFAPVVANTREQFLQSLGSGKFPVALCCLAPEDSTLFQSLKFFREHAEFRWIQILLLLEVASQQFVLELIKAGFHHICTQAQPEQQKLEKLITLTKHLGGGPDRRQHLRLEVYEYENAKLIIALPNARKVTALVKNISIGGLQVAFRERLFVRLAPGDILTNCLMVFKNLDLTSDMKVVNMQDKGLALQFHQLDELRTTAIAQLIQERIQLEF